MLISISLHIIKKKYIFPHIMSKHRNHRNVAVTVRQSIPSRGFLLCCDTELSQPTKQPTHTNTSSTSSTTAGSGPACLGRKRAARQLRAESKESGGRTASSGGCCPSPRQLLMDQRGPTGSGPGTLNSSHSQGASWRQQRTEK